MTMKKTQPDKIGFDTHTHLIPPAVLKMAERGEFGLGMENGKLLSRGHRIPTQRITNADLLLSRIEQGGLEAGLVSLPPPLYRPDLDDATRRSYAETLNQLLLETCAAHSPLLRPMAYLPVEDPELAADIAGSLGPEWAGVIIGTELNDLTFSDPRFDALWTALEENALTVLLHPGDTPDARLKPFYLSNLLGNPMETTVAVAHLVFADVPRRFPGLKMILSHAGGSVAALAGRWQKGLDTARPNVSPDMEPPLEALKRFYVDTVAHSPAFLETAISVFGEDKIVLGSDWPFPMGTETAEDGIDHLPESLRAKFRLDNVEAAFGKRLRSSAELSA